jgi:cell division protein FtsB
MSVLSEIGSRRRQYGESLDFHILLPRLLLSLYAGFALYCIISIFVGPVGVLSYKRLETKEKAMGQNLERLSSIHENLSSELEALKSDPDRAAREARSLGYLRKGETGVILGSESEKKVEPIDTGTVLPLGEEAGIGDGILKKVSLGFGLAILALLLSPRSRTGLRAPRRFARKRERIYL